MFEPAAELSPPAPVERVGHHLEDDDRVAVDTPFLALPQPFGGSARVSGQAAETFDQLCPHLSEELGRLRRAIVAPQRQKDLDHMHRQPNARTGARLRTSLCLRVSLGSRASSWLRSAKRAETHRT